MDLEIEMQHRPVYQSALGGEIGAKVGEASKESLIDFEGILHNLNAGVYIIDARGYFIFVNKAIEERSGIPVEKIIGRHFLEIVDPKYHERVQANFQKAMKAEQVDPYELEYRTEQGKQ